MLFGEDFLEAEHKHRRELLRDQNQKAKMSTFAKKTTLILAASMVLAACGAPVENQAGAKAESYTTRALMRDSAPTWEPNYSLLESILGTEVLPTSVTADVGVFAGPGWQPDMAKLDSILNPQTDVGVFAGPTWEPDRGGLETILNPRQPAGPR